MAHSTMFRCAIAAVLMLAATTAAAEPAAPKPQPTCEAKKTVLERANDDLTRQLRPSGLKRHAHAFGSLAERGFRDTVITLTGKSLPN